MSMPKDNADFMETPLIRTAYEECHGTIEEEEERARYTRQREDDRAPVEDALHSSASSSGISTAVVVDNGNGSSVLRGRSHIKSSHS